MDTKDIGKRIRIARALKGMTATELANKVGFNSKSQISIIENNKTSITAKKLPIFAEALGVSIEYLLGQEEIEIKSVTREEREKTQLKEELKEELLKEMITLKKQEENADKW